MRKIKDDFDTIVRLLEGNSLLNDEPMMPPQPKYVCNECGQKYGNRSIKLVSTWHQAECGVCKKISVVTEPRDFGYLKTGWNKEST